MLRLLCLILILLYSPSAFALVSSITDEDTSPDTYPWRVIVPDGCITDNGDGSTTLSCFNEDTPVCGVEGAVQFSDGAEGHSCDATNFYWDDTNKELGIGVNAPGGKLEVQNADSVISLLIDTDVDQKSISIDSEASTEEVIDIAAAASTTGNIISVTSANSLTTGSMLYLQSGSAETDVRYLANIINDDADATGAVALRLQQDSTGDILQFYDGGTQVTTIDDEGQLGLGETSPDQMLHLTTDEIPAIKLEVTDDSTGGDIPQLQFVKSNSAIVDGRRIAQLSSYVGSSETEIAGIYMDVVGTDEDSGRIEFWTNDSGGGMTERMRIDSAGLVGIGTSSPGELLEVSGDNAKILVQGSTAAGIFLEDNGATDDPTFAWQTLGDRIRLNYADDAPTTSTDIVAIKSNGNVGIGTSTPIAKLEVEVGSSDAVTGILVDQNDDNKSISIDSEATSEEVIDIAAPASTTGNIISVTSANSLTTGAMLYLDSSSAQTDTRNLAEIINNNSSASGTTVLDLQQDADQRALFIDQNGDANSIRIDSEATTEAAINVRFPQQTTGHIIYVDRALSRTTGHMLYMRNSSTDVTSGRLAYFESDVAANGLANKSSQQVFIESDRQELRTSGTTADDYDTLSVLRLSRNDGAGGTFTAAGSVARFENVATENDGTLTDTVDVLELIQDDDSSGDLIKASNSGGEVFAIDVDGAIDTVLTGNRCVQTDASGVLTVSAEDCFTSSEANNTLDEAYDEGGAGSGRSIIADSGSVEITTPDTSSNVVLSIIQQDTTNNPDALTAENDGTGDGLFLNQDGNGIALSIDSEATTADVAFIDADQVTTASGLEITADGLTTGDGLRVISDSSDGSSRQVVTFRNDNTFANSTTVLKVLQEAGHDAIFVDLDTTNSTDGSAIEIDSENTNDAALHIAHKGDGSSIGDSAIYVIAESGNGAFNASRDVAGTDAPLMTLLEDNASADEEVVFIDNDGNGISFSIDSESTTANVIDISDAESTTGRIFNIGSANSLTTGTGLNVGSSSEVISSGLLIRSALASNGSSITAKTGNLNEFTSSRTETRTSGTTADDYEMVAMVRDNIMNGAGGTLTSTGSVLYIENDPTETAGTLTDTVRGMEILMRAGGSGDGIFVDQNSEAISLSIDSESTTSDIIDISGANLTTSSYAIDISDLDSLGFGAGGIKIVSDSDSNSVRSLIKVVNDNTAASGTRLLELDNDSSYNTLFINNDGNGQAIYIDSESSNSAMDIDSTATLFPAVEITANSLTTGEALRVHSNSSVTSTRNVVEIINNNSLAINATPLAIQQDAAQRALFIDQNAAGLSVSIDTESATTDVIDIASPGTQSGNVFDVDADSLTTGKILDLTSDSSDINTRALVQITNDNTAAVGTTALSIKQDADSTAQFINHDGNGLSFYIDSEAATSDTIYIDAAATTEGDALEISVDTDNLTTGHAFKISGGSDAVTEVFSIDAAGAIDTVLTGSRCVETDSNGVLTVAADTCSGVVGDTFAAIEVGGTGVSTNAPTLDFDSGDFTLTETPTDDFDIVIAIDSESELESQLTDVSDVFTDNDGALDDDDLSDNTLDDISQTSLADPGADRIVFWDDSDTQYEFLTASTGLTITTNSITVNLGDDIDISDETNLTADDGLTLTGDELDVVTLTTGADADSTTNSSDSFLEIVDNQLTLLRGCTDNQVPTWDETSDVWTCSSPGTGTMSIVKEGDFQVGDSDISTLDFGPGFDLTEDPDTEINIVLDYTEDPVDLGTGEVTGTLDVSDHTNLTAGTNITLTDDDLSVDDAFIINSGDDEAGGDVGFPDGNGPELGAGDDAKIFWNETDDVVTFQTIDESAANIDYALITIAVDSDNSGVETANQEVFEVGKDGPDDSDGNFVELMALDEDGDLTISGTYTGTNVTSGANPGHTHTTVSISDLDVSDDLNLTADDGLTLTDDELDVVVVTSGSNGDSLTTDSDSGLEFVSNELTLLRGCDDNEILKWDETEDDWNCEEDDDVPDDDSEVPDAITVDGGTVQGSTIIFDISSNPSTDGQVVWNTTSETIQVGDDGGDTYDFYPGAHTTDTNASTVCDGDTVYLDGDGNCDSIVVSTVSLQGAYDNDGDGSDAIISLTTADDSVEIDNPSSSGTDSAYLLLLDQNAASGVSVLQIEQSAVDGEAITIQSPANTAANVIDVDADALTSGSIISLTSGSTDATARTLAYIQNSSTGNAVVMEIEQVADDVGLFLDQQGDGSAIDIVSGGTTANIIEIDSISESGHGIYMERIVSGSGNSVYLYENTNNTTAHSVLRLENDDPTATATTMLTIDQDSTADMISGIDGTTEVFEVDDEGNLTAQDVTVSDLFILTPSGVTDVAVTGITPTNSIMTVQGDGGAIDITANPQIADGTDGQILIIKGESDTNTVKLDEGAGLDLDGDVSMTLHQRDTIMFYYDAGDDLWIELSRTDSTF